MGQTWQRRSWKNSYIGASEKCSRMVISSRRKKASPTLWKQIWLFVNLPVQLREISEPAQGGVLIKDSLQYWK